MVKPATIACRSLDLKSDKDNVKEFAATELKQAENNAMMETVKTVMDVTRIAR